MMDIADNRSPLIHQCNQIFNLEKPIRQARFYRWGCFQRLVNPAVVVMDEKDRGHAHVILDLF